MGDIFSAIPAIVDAVTKFVQNAGLSESTFMASILIVTLVGVGYVVQSDRATPQKIVVSFLSVGLSFYTIAWVASNMKADLLVRNYAHLTSVRFHRDYVDGSGFVKVVSGSLRRVTSLQWKEEHDQDENGLHEVHRFEFVAESADGVLLAEGRPECFALLRISKSSNAIDFKCIGAADEFQKIYDATEFAFAAAEPEAVRQFAGIR